MARYLIVSWDGAGNLVPTLAITRGLVRAGHDVRVLGHNTTRELVLDTGARFVALTQAEGWDELEAPDDFEAEMKLLIEELCFSTLIARDTAAELSREPVDAVLVDCMLFTALDAAHASGVPTATLFHAPYAIFRGGELVEMFAPGIALSNAYRAELGLDPITALGDAHDACALALVAVPAEFEPVGLDAPNVVRMGPALDAPPLVRTSDAVDLADGERPMVLVSLSTSEQGQADLLQRCADAVAQLPVRAIVTTGPSIDPASVRVGANTQVVTYVPHADLLASTSLVITHAGLGTTMAALGSGVPMVCVPMGRDQFFNAEQVARLGAGQMLMPDADVDAIALAAREVLADGAYQDAAKRMATTIAGYGGAADAVSALERISSAAKR